MAEAGRVLTAAGHGADGTGVLGAGIVPVVQTPFDGRGRVDEESLARLVDATIAAGARGFLAPAVASEVAMLSGAERRRIVQVVLAAAGGRVPLLAGASAETAAECIEHGRVAAQLGAAAFLVAVPPAGYEAPESVLPFFEQVAAGVDLPLVIQDLEWSGPGLSIGTITELAARLPSLAGIKVETVPAGPKYTRVRQALGPGVWIAGGWAAPQMIEALDRGVDAMIPECSMVQVYARVFELHRTGARGEAVRLFRGLLPVLAFANQEIRTSIAFFKRLLVRKGLFAGETMRGEAFEWDEYNTRVAEELLQHYLELERSCGAGSGPP